VVNSRPASAAGDDGPRWGGLGGANARTSLEVDTPDVRLSVFLEVVVH
jgi:hypothetical protein